MEEKQVKSIIESMLFVWGDPLDIKNIGQSLDLPPQFIRKCLIDLKQEYEKEERGIQIIEINERFQFCTHPKYYPYIQKLCTPTPNKGLTQAALEVLAIIAYNQPITRVDIEKIRGVKSDKAINTLLEKDMIMEKGRVEKPGRPILYGTTELFLRAFGLNKLKDLPSIEEFHESEFTDLE